MDLVIQGYCCQLEMPALPQCKSALPGFFLLLNQTVIKKCLQDKKESISKVKMGKMYLCFKAFICFATHTCLNSLTVKYQTMKFQVKEGFWLLCPRKENKASF